MGYVSSCDDYVQRDQAAIMSVCDPEGLAAAKHVDEAGNPTLNAQLACKEVDMEAQDGVKVISEAKGTWTHAAYHLTSSTAGPPLLSLPFAMAALGWGVGIVALALGAAVSYYACYSLSLAMEHLHHKGKRSLRYCDLSEHVLGAKWTYYLVAPLQLSVCFMVVIGGILLGGQSMKEIYLVLNEEGIVELYSFIIIFGTFVLLLSQMPTMHSLRHFNFISILLCLGFSLCAFIGSLMAGSSREASVQHYNVHGTEISKVLGIFTAISVMVTAYSNPLVIEIQASMAMPIERKMLKGLGVCYSIAVSTFFPVAISGYWAFGNATNGVIFLNMFEPRKFLLVPRWLYFAGNAFACIQLIVYTVEMTRSMDQIPREEKGKMIVDDSEDSWDEGYDSTGSDTSFHHGEIETINFARRRNHSSNTTKWEMDIQLLNPVFQCIERRTDPQTERCYLHIGPHTWWIPLHLLKRQETMAIHPLGIPHKLKLWWNGYNVLVYED